MALTLKRCAVLLAVLSAFMVWYSCSSGPAAPEPGTPGFFWNAAKGGWEAGDWTATAEHLDDVLSKDADEYGPRALPWALVLTSGMTDGYMEAADAYQKGVKANKAGAEPLRREMVRYHDAASRLILQFADKFESFNKLNLDSVPLAFAFPKGSAAEAPTLLTVAMGSAPTAALIDSALKQTLERNMILAAAKAVGCADDPAKAGQIFASPDAKVPRATFQLAMANHLFAMSEMFAATKLDDSEKREILCKRAQDALKSVPESPDTKELTDKIAAAIKQLPKKS